MVRVLIIEKLGNIKCSDLKILILKNYIKNVI